MHLLQQATFKEKCCVLVSKSEISNKGIVSFAVTEHAIDVPIGQDSFATQLQRDKAQVIRLKSMFSQRAKSAEYVIGNFS